ARARSRSSALSRVVPLGCPALGLGALLELALEVRRLVGAAIVLGGARLLGRLLCMHAGVLLALHLADAQLLGGGILVHQAASLMPASSRVRARCSSARDSIWRTRSGEIPSRRPVSRSGVGS